MTKANDLRALDDSELLTRLGESKQELFNLRFQLVTGQLDNNARIGHIRKEVARIMYLLREREIAAYEASVAASAADGGNT